MRKHYLSRLFCNKSDAGFWTLGGWEDKGDTSFVSRDCVDHNRTANTFQIRRTGLYTVYSHLAFSGPILPHEIYGQMILVNGNDNVPLAADYQLLVPSTTTAGSNDAPSVSDLPVHNTIVMATIRLRANDRLSVKATPVNCVLRSDSKALSYFGFFMQGSQDDWWNEVILRTKKPI